MAPANREIPKAVLMSKEAFLFVNKLFGGLDTGVLFFFLIKIILKIFLAQICLSN